MGMATAALALRRCSSIDLRASCGSRRSREDSRATRRRSPCHARDLRRARALSRSKLLFKERGEDDCRMRRSLPFCARCRWTPRAAWRKPRWVRSASGPDTSSTGQSFCSLRQAGLPVSLRAFLRARCSGVLAAARHGGAGGVDAPLALDIILCFFEKDLSPAQDCCAPAWCSVLRGRRIP